MKIKYECIADPGVTKIYDTKLALKNAPFTHKNQEEFDAFELKNFRKKKEQGIVIDYEVIEP